MRVLIASVVVLGVSVLAGQAVLAQGVAQPAQTAAGANQQRQNGYTVGPGYATSTSPATNTFRSPFSSPFGASGSSSQTTKSGYAGSGAR